MLGKTLGPYRIESELGSGGMGKVYAATVEGRCPGIEEGTKVALKVVHPHLLETPGFFKRFLRDHAGKEYRTSILENVPLHRDIVAAFAEHGGESRLLGCESGGAPLFQAQPSPAQTLPAILSP